MMKAIFQTANCKRGLIILLVLFILSSCKKNDTTVTPDLIQKPRVGTVWTYRYYVYNPPSAGGGVHTSEVVNYKAKSEDVYAGEKWLTIVNAATDTVVFILNEKTGGLYRYGNNASNLFCKDPAALNDTYTTFNDGGPETFTVKGAKDSLSTSIGDITANFYEGVKVGYLIDQIWYNPNAWIVRRHFYLYAKDPGGVIFYYRYSTLYINDIKY